MAGTENDDKAAAWKAAAMARMGSFSDDELDEALKDFVETADGMEMSELLSELEGNLFFIFKYLLANLLI